MAKRNAVLHPIIYVRGYAMTRGEIDDTTADPFCGFNIGSTVFRATPDKNRPPRKFIFESPVLRLGAEGYSDVFTDGLDIADPDWNQSISRQSIIIYRYYDPASNLLGTGETPEIQEFAKGLSRLIERVRDLVCQDPKNNTTVDAFRCYLVAHSMGGLVCRAFLQNPKLDEKGTRKHVDKFFTYATPHNGIDMAGVNVPRWLSPMDLKNFNRESMADFLDLKQVFKKTKRVDWKNSEASARKPLSFYLSTVFLDKDARVDKTRSSLAYSMTLGARVPDYEVERRLWLNEHYEGGYLFRDSATIEIFPPQNSNAAWEVKFDWQSVNPGKATTSLLPRPLNDKQLEFIIPFGNDKHPGIRGSLRFIASEWNYWNT